MQPSLSERIVASYLLCKTKAALTLAGESGIKSEYEILAEEAAKVVRTRYLEQFAAETILDGVEVNRKVLKAGAPIIANGTIDSGGAEYAFDLLVRRRGDSALGNFHYVPAIFYGGYSNPPRARQILTLTGSKLTPLQKFAPKHGLVINAAHDRETRTVLLLSKPSETKRLLMGIDAVRTELPDLQVNSHCSICEFRTRCEATAKQGDDISLLKGLGPKAIAKLRRRGIFTVFQYAHTYRARRNHSGTGGAPRQHALQAMAVRDHKLYVIGKPEIPQSSISVYLDFEGDPERGFVYLIGALVCRDGASRQYSFWADETVDEPKIVTDLYQLLSSLESFHAYCYGGYESTNLKRWATFVEGKALLDLLIPKFTNVLNVIYRHLYLPTYSNGLKDIASSLGFKWRMPNASGAISVLWRRQWERTRTLEMKQQLVDYNADDCVALSITTDAVCGIAGGKPVLPWSYGRIEKQVASFATPTWETAKLQTPEFEFINKRAYFDYQRNRIFLRNGRKRRSRSQSRQTSRYSVRCTELRAIEEKTCPYCRQTNIERRELCQRTKVQYDLKVRRSSVTRVVRHCKAYRYYCHDCRTSFRASRFARIKRYGHVLQSWIALQNISYRASFESAASLLRDVFGIPIHRANAYHAKAELANVYEPLFQDSLERILRGSLIHADETEILMNNDKKAYVWVLSNMDDAVFIYRESREIAFLEELLREFRGVLVSDFYVGYDSIACKQQRCLVHLMRDLNQSIRLAPFDPELREIAESFGSLLKSIVARVDEFGLRASKLQRFKKLVAQFFARLETSVYSSEAAEGYRLRFLRNRSKLFTFIEYDNVPWNNNSAEHAMKYVARFREETRSLHTVRSIQNHLRLLGIYLTCKYKDIPFLKFLLSRRLSFAPDSPKIDDDWFDLYPPGYQSPRRKTKNSTPNPPPHSERSTSACFTSNVVGNWRW